MFQGYGIPFANAGETNDSHPEVQLWEDVIVTRDTYDGESGRALEEEPLPAQRPLQCADFPLVTNDIFANYGPGSQVSSSTSSSTALNEINLHPLSPELVPLFDKWFCTYSFDPGRLYPQQIPNEHGGFTESGTRVLPPCPKAFKALSSSLYRKYRENLWSKSTWVIGEGSAFYSTDFLNAIPDSIFNAIRSVELKFVSQGVGLENRVLEGAEDVSAHDIASFESEVSDIWWDKFTAVSNLHLDHLRLDFTEAYAPNGTYLGDAVTQLFQPFTYGVPANLEIVAADATIVANFRAIILAQNP